MKTKQQIQDRLNLLKQSKLEIERELDSHKFPLYSLDEDLAYSSVQAINDEIVVLNWVLKGDD